MAPSHGCTLVMAIRQEASVLCLMVFSIKELKASSWHGDVSPREGSPQKTKVETVMSYMMEPQHSHRFTSKLFLFWVRPTQWERGKKSKQDCEFQQARDHWVPSWKMVAGEGICSLTLDDSLSSHMKNILIFFHIPKNLFLLWQDRKSVV